MCGVRSHLVMTTEESKRGRHADWPRWRGERGRGHPLHGLTGLVATPASLVIYPARLFRVILGASPRAGPFAARYIQRMSNSELVEFSGTAVCALDGCAMPASPQVNGGGGRFFCTRQHLNASVGRELARPWCPTCNRKFDPREDYGRRQVYCSQSCKSARERDLDRAAKELARDSGTGHVREQLYRSELLYSVWAYDRAGSDGWLGESLAERFWRGRVPPRLSPPATNAVNALHKRVNALRVAVAEADRIRRRDEVRQVEADVEDQLARQRRAEREAEHQWRTELLTASHVERGGDDGA